MTKQIVALPNRTLEETFEITSSLLEHLFDPIPIIYLYPNAKIVNYYKGDIKVSIELWKDQNEFTIKYDEQGAEILSKLN